MFDRPVDRVMDRDERHRQLTVNQFDSNIGRGECGPDLNPSVAQVPDCFENKLSVARLFR